LERSNKDKIIVVQPLGGFDSSLLPIVQQHLVILFNTEVRILQNIPFPDSISIKYGGKYPADSLLPILAKKKTGNVVEVIGLTEKEIFIPKLYSGFTIPAAYTVRGYGYVNNGISVVSYFNMKSTDFQLGASRLLKAITHEVGHNLGLVHCPSSGCIMNEQSGNIVILDKVTGAFCEICKKKAN
jgi:archaemetzincin